MDIEGVSVLADFEVINIVDNSNRCPTLLGIDCAFDMDEIINLKKCRMTFERKELRIIIPLDLTEGAWYTEPIRDYEQENDLDHIYKIITCDEDLIKPMVDGQISLDRDSSCTSDSDE